MINTAILVWEQMSKVLLASAVVLLLDLPAIGIAGSLKWAPAGPYPNWSSCQPVSFNQPDALAVDRSDNIYIANEAGTNAVQEVTVAGNSTIRTVLSRSIEPIKSGHYFGLSLAFDRNGQLYLAVKDRGTVERINPNGTLTVVAGNPTDRRLVDGSPSLARLNSPNAIAVGEDGTIYVSDTRTIRKISADGSIITLAGNPYAKNPHPVGGGAPYYVDGQGAKAVFMSTNGIAVDHTGNLYVADGYAGEEEGQSELVGIIRRVSPKGVVTTLAGTLLDGGADFDGVGVHASFGYLYGLVRSSTGTIYVTEPDTPSVRKITKNGDASTVIAGSFGAATGPTGLVVPVGITIDDRETLFITDDVAYDGSKDRPTDWLHRINGNGIETLCAVVGVSK